MLEKHGFTPADAATEPWIGVNPNHVEINAAEEFDDPESVYGFYKKLIAMRHNSATVATGEWNLLAADDEQVYAFTRTSGDDTILVVVNLTDRSAGLPGEVAELLGDGVNNDQFFFLCHLFSPPSIWFLLIWNQSASRDSSWSRDRYSSHKNL